MASNNNHRDEPRTTALKRQVQTLATTVERLTRQNHDLEEQLHQKDARPNNYREEQESTNTEMRDQEGPEGSNAPSRQERQDTSHPSVADTAPLHMVAEIQMMKERMDFMINTLKGWVSNDLDELVHRTDSLFTVLVTSFPLPTKFYMP